MTVIVYQVSNIKAKKNNYLNNFQHTIPSLHMCLVRYILRIKNFKKYFTLLCSFNGSNIEL